MTHECAFKQTALT